MTEANHNAPPRDLKVIADNPVRITYVGTDAACLAAGILKAEWLEGLGHLARQIAVDPAGGFTVLGEGKGNRIKRTHREHGALTIKRLRDGSLQVECLRTPAEESAFNAARDAEFEQERRSRAWATAAATTTSEFAPAWRRNVAAEIDKIVDLITGRLVYTGLPEFRMDGAALAEACELAERLRKAVLASTPRALIAEKSEPASNVIHLRDRTYRAMMKA